MKKSKYNFEKFFGPLLKTDVEPIAEEPEVPKVSYYERNKERIKEQRRKKLDEKGRKYKKVINWKDPEERRKYGQKYYHQKIKQDAVPEITLKEPLKIRTDVFEEAVMVVDPPRIVVINPPKRERVLLTEEEKRARRRAYYVRNREDILDKARMKNGYRQPRGVKQPFRVRGGPGYKTRYMRQYKRIHPEIRRKTTEYLRKERETLSDVYIVRELSRGPRAEFRTKQEAWNNPEAIERKRNGILIHRIKRQIKYLTK